MKEVDLMVILAKAFRPEELEVCVIYLITFAIVSVIIKFGVKSSRIRSDVRDIAMIFGLSTIICIIEVFMYTSAITVLMAIGGILFTSIFATASLAPQNYFDE